MVYIPEGVGNIARASLVAFEAIKPFWTHSFLAVNAFESRVTYAGSVDMVALGPVLAVTGLRALEAVGADGTLLLTPAMGWGRWDPVTGTISSGHGFYTGTFLLMN